MTRTIIWDVDDVLNGLTRAWLDAWLERRNGTTIAYGDLRENPPNGLLHIGMDEYTASLDEFRLSRSYAALEPNREILAWMRVNGERCRHVALTATSFHAAPATASWVFAKFGRWIREFAFIPAARAGEALPTYDVDKGVWVARRGGDAVLVDDGPANIGTAIAHGARALCWPQPWNSGVSPAATLDTLTRLIADQPYEAV